MRFIRRNEDCFLFSFSLFNSQLQYCVCNTQEKYRQCACQRQSSLLRQNAIGGFFSTSSFFFEIISISSSFARKDIQLARKSAVFINRNPPQSHCRREKENNIGRTAAAIARIRSREKKNNTRINCNQNDNRSTAVHFLFLVTNNHFRTSREEKQQLQNYLPLLLLLDWIYLTQASHPEEIPERRYHEIILFENIHLSADRGGCNFNNQQLGCSRLGQQ